MITVGWFSDSREFVIDFNVVFHEFLLITLMLIQLSCSLLGVPQDLNVLETNDYFFYYR